MLEFVSQSRSRAVDRTKSGAFQGMKSEKSVTYDSKGSPTGTIREINSKGQVLSSTHVTDGLGDTRLLSYADEAVTVTNPYTGEQEAKIVHGSQSWEQPGYTPPNLTKKQKQVWDYYHKGYGYRKEYQKPIYTGSKGIATGKDRRKQLHEAAMGKVMTPLEEAKFYHGPNAYVDVAQLPIDVSRNYEETGRGQSWRRYLYEQTHTHHTQYTLKQTAQ